MRKAFYQVAVALCLTAQPSRALNLESTTNTSSSDSYDLFNGSGLTDDLTQFTHLSQSAATLPAQPELEHSNALDPLSLYQEEMLAAQVGTSMYTIPAESS